MPAIRLAARVTRDCVLAIALALAFALMLGLFHAQRAMGHDGRNDAWFESLTSPKHGGPCCSHSDCKATEFTMEGDHYRALLPNGQWVDVPNELIIYNRGNPIGEPILCALPLEDGSYGILCFIPGGAT